MSAEVDPADGIGLTVAQLAAEELLRDTVVAGERGTHRLVTWCVPGGYPIASETDARDLCGAAVFLHSDELAAHATELIPRLAECDAAAVLAWPGPGREHPDLASAVETADAVGLPLLKLASRATFRETSQLIATKVLAQSTHVLEYGTRVHRILGDVFARGAGLGALADTMARISGTEVLVLSQGGELIAQGRGDRPDPTPAAHVEQIVERLSDDGYFHDVHVAHEPAHVVRVDLEGEPRHLVVTRVLVAAQPYGVLVLIEPDYPAAEHDLAQHRVIAEQGVSLTGSELLRQQSVREAQERARNDFVHALLHGRFTDQFELAARAEHYRFPLDGRFAVFVLASPEIRPDDAAGRRRAVDVARAARAMGSADDAVSLVALIGSMIVVVQQAPDPARGDRREEARLLRQYGDRLHRTAARRLGEGVTVTFGRAYPGATGVAQSYREARTAEALGKRVSASPVCAYEDLRVFAALQESARSPVGLAFASEVLAPLQQSDGQTGNLETVVLAYIAEAGNLNAAARRLHLHRNTMLYKLERASRALHMDIRTTEAQFMIWLAHHISALSDIVVQLDEELAPPS